MFSFLHLWHGTKCLSRALISESILNDTSHWGMVTDLKQEFHNLVNSQTRIEGRV